MRTERKELNIQIGKRLQIARENGGYTQETFAEALDVGVEHPPDCISNDMRKGGFCI